jgi:hypothetical protein
MKKLIFSAISIAFLAVSCKKDTPGTPAGETKFMTTTAGSVWNYKTTDSTTLTVTPYTLTSTANDTTLNARSYHIFTYADANGSNSEYYAISGNEYYQYTELSAQLPPFEAKYLVDNINVGSTWTQPFTASQTQQGITLTLNATIKYTIEEKGASVTVNGVTYNNTIKVRTDIINPSVTSSSPFLSVSVLPITQDVYAYYAPKYGVVKRKTRLKVDINISLLGDQNVIDNNTVTELVSTNIP